MTGRRILPLIRSMSVHQRRLVWAYLFASPPVLYFGAFTIYPLLRGIYLSLTEWSIIGPPRFVGLANYIKLIHDSSFRVSLGATLYYTTGVVAAAFVFSLALAVFFQRAVPLRPLLRTSYFIPTVTPMVVIGLVWNYAFNASFGFIPEIMAVLGLGRPAWLSNPKLALPALIIVGVWRMLGFNMILFLAGLQGIDETLYDAAKVDGAASWEAFWHITWPLLRPTSLMILVVSVMSSLQAFDLAYSLTGGGPAEATRVVMLNVYETGFRHLRMGYALSKALVLFVLMFAVSLLQLRVVGGYKNE